MVTWSLLDVLKGTLTQRQLLYWFSRAHFIMKLHQWALCKTSRSPTAVEDMHLQRVECPIDLYTGLYQTLFLCLCIFLSSHWQIFNQATTLKHLLRVFNVIFFIKFHFHQKLKLCYVDVYLFYLLQAILLEKRDSFIFQVSKLNWNCSF